MKVVIDTNIFISGLISSSGAPDKIIKAWRNGQIDVILSEEGIEEIIKVLHYPKILKRLKWNELEILNYVSTLRFMCDIVNISNVEAKVPKDQSDNHILATFIVSKADFLITGDTDFLELKEEYEILTPSEFEKMFLL